MKLFIILSLLLTSFSSFAWRFQTAGSKTMADKKLCLSGLVPIVNSFGNNSKPNLFNKYYSGFKTHKRAFNNTSGKVKTGTLNGTIPGKKMKCATQDSAKKWCGPKSKDCNAGYHCVKTYYAREFRGRCLRKN